MLFWNLEIEFKDESSVIYDLFAWALIVSVNTGTEYLKRNKTEEECRN